MSVNKRITDERTMLSQIVNTVSEDVTRVSDFINDRMGNIFIYETTVTLSIITNVDEKLIRVFKCLCVRIL